MELDCWEEFTVTGFMEEVVTLHTLMIPDFLGNGQVSSFTTKKLLS